MQRLKNTNWTCKDWVKQKGKKILEYEYMQYGFAIWNKTNEENVVLVE